jgi:hypothetical protein
LHHSGRYSDDPGCDLAVQTTCCKNIWAIIKERNLLHVPIISQDSKSLGVINALDALCARLGEVEHEESLLRDDVMGIGYR